jgi:hypothetical protein
MAECECAYQMTEVGRGWGHLGKDGVGLMELRLGLPGVM